MGGKDIGTMSNLLKKNQEMQELNVLTAAQTWLCSTSWIFYGIFITTIY